MPDMCRTNVFHPDVMETYIGFSQHFCVSRGPCRAP